VVRSDSINSGLGNAPVTSMALEAMLNRWPSKASAFVNRA
jgi:hypothetical protein